MSQLLARFASHAEDHTTMIVDDDGGAHTYAAVVARAARIAAALLGGDRPLREGQRVALLIQPCADFVAAFFGILLAKGCVVVLSPIHPTPESLYFCADAEVAAVLYSERHGELAAELGGACELRPVAALDRSIGNEALTNPRALAEPVPESAHALQLYTSGTTGRPKGAVLTHANIAVQQELVGAAWGFRREDALLHALPLHHMHGLAIALLTAIGAGASARLRAFDATAIWDEMADATVFMGVPSMYHRLLLAFDGADETCRARWTANARGLRLATSGSAALPVTVAERWRSITGAIPLERFGMTEIGVGLTNALAPSERVAGLVGLPLPTVETRIVGDDGAEAASGELWIRGPSVFAGYHRRDEETAKAFVPSDARADGAGDGAWFRTGDTVTRDDTRPGSPFKILGRTSVDILKSGGYKLSALEIEEVLRAHAAVEEVAVVGVPDEAWGERVVACVVLRTDARCDASTLRAFVREHLAPYKVPKDVVFLDALPKNALGKVVKPTLLRQLTT